MSTKAGATDFRAAVARFASGVVVVTGHDHEPLGLTCQSFASLSLDPVQVVLGLGRDSRSWSRIRETGRFGVNILGAAQRHLSERFAGRGADKFDGLRWQPGVHGVPLLDGALAHLECDLAAVHDGGDHDLVVGRVGHVHLAEPEGDPLIYYGSGYRSLAPAPSDSARLTSLPVGVRGSRSTNSKERGSL